MSEIRYLLFLLLLLCDVCDIYYGVLLFFYDMLREPDVGELVDWLHDRDALTIPAIRSLASTKPDPWRVSIKRIRQFLSQRRANSALILPSAGESRDAVLQSITMGHLEHIDSAGALESIATFIGDAEPELLGLLYEANRNTIAWYYEKFLNKTSEVWNPLTWASWTHALWFLSKTEAGPGTRRVIATFDAQQMFKAALQSETLYRKVLDYLEIPEEAEDGESSSASTLSQTSTEDSHDGCLENRSARALDEHLAVVRGPTVEDLPAEVSLEILGNLTFAERLSFARASPVAALHVAQTIHAATVSFLRTFGLHPRSIRLMQVATRTLISGSFIPAIMCEAFEPNDIDFYTPKAAGHDVARFFKKSGDWSRIKFSTTYNFASGIGHVYTMRHRTSEMKINIIESLTLNALDAVVQFHSTCVIGAISADSFWHGYPDLTLARVSITSPARMPLTKDIVQQTRTWTILRKYAARGYDFHLGEFRAPHTCCEDARCPATVRTSDDSGCVRIPLPKWEFSTPGTPECVSCWTFSGCGCPGGILSRAPISQVSLATSPGISHWRFMMNHLLNAEEAPGEALGLF
ncbi:hypothetical protein C8F04DRAFT_1248517 [Mycena alexandri]|uniref:Uncharacterized protein n=1 Tax=Mycena alexandri TaxID=1745969 RepID=A0AAD6XFG4_9AGAR|nr:hypothetical protein C8F04DRAFT_1248517 [Mycena alexandri]